MLGKFSQVISKEGEIEERYRHWFEDNRDATTNLKESKWTLAGDVTAIVRSQPESLSEMVLGLYEGEVIIILTETEVLERDIIKWQYKYYDVVMVEAMYFRKTLDYYKGTCIRRVEFLGN